MRTAVSLFGLLVLVIAGLLLAQRQAPAEGEGSRGPAVDEIRAPDLAAHLEFLSHDLLEGRAPSTRGGELAAEYLATQLATLGFQPAGDDNTYFQEFSIVETTVDPAFALSAGAGAAFKYLDDVVAFSGVQEPKVSASGELVFVGHGIVAPEFNWNDYAGVDMKGRIALVMVNDPPATTEEPQLFGGKALTYYGRWTYKFEEAARQGAAGAILIHTPESATYPWQVVQSGFSGTQYAVPVEPGTPVLQLKAWVTEDAARTIARRANQDLDALRKAAQTRGATPVPLGAQVSASISQKVQRRTTANVIGKLEGSSSPNQAVIYTAHYDHFPMRELKPGEAPDTDRIFNGALDNASGTAGVLEIAQALARARGRARRTFYVVFTAAEESGLLGSEYLATHLPLPAAQFAANINIDVLNVYGPAKDVVLLGAERSSLGPLATTLAGRLGRVVMPDPEPERGSFYRSDHFPLAKVGIPAVSIQESVDFTGPNAAELKKRRDAFNDTDYHQPNDEIKEYWDYRGAVDDLRFYTELGWLIANDTAMPAYNAGEQFARPRQ
jgi:Zn-dependent M28 family amino/carboxypeptidase